MPCVNVWTEFHGRLIGSADHNGRRTESMARVRTGVKSMYGLCVFHEQKITNTDNEEVYGFQIFLQERFVRGSCCTQIAGASHHKF